MRSFLVYYSTKYVRMTCYKPAWVGVGGEVGRRETVAIL